MDEGKKKAEASGAETVDAKHPIEASGVLQAAKDGSFAKFAALLKSQTHLSFEDFNSLPPGRTFGVLHQIAFHGNRAALQALLTAHPRVDLKFLTKGGKSAEEVAVEEGADASFLAFLREYVRRRSARTCQGECGIQLEFGTSDASKCAEIEFNPAVTDGTCALCGLTQDEHYHHVDGKKYCEYVNMMFGGRFWTYCCNCASMGGNSGWCHNDTEHNRVRTHGCGHCKARFVGGTPTKIQV
jgi:hypothetical protein